jgi:hypothetical protein
MGESTTIDNQPTGIRRWIIEHDDSWLFIIAYIGLAVVLSIWISLFWLVAVVAVHLAFEVVRQKATHEQWTTIISQALWELKLDIALVLFALVVSLYMEVVLGVVGLQGVARAGAATQAGLRGGARFAAWQRIIRGVLLSVDDAAQVARVVVGKGNGAADEAEETAVIPASPWGSWIGPWGRGDWIAVGMGVVCLLLLVLSPYLTDHTFHSAFVTLAAELHPYPLD